MIETLTIFEDVFIPWERVFLAGEWQAAGLLALTFVEFHRFTAVSYKLPLVDALAGAAYQIAEFNGIGRAGHVREKLTWLAAYSETLRALIRQAAIGFTTKPPGIAVPDPYADQYREVALRRRLSPGNQARTGFGRWAACDWSQQRRP